jgi:hypothetical protein
MPSLIGYMENVACTASTTYGDLLCILRSPSLAYRISSFAQGNMNVILLLRDCVSTLGITHFPYLFV